MRTPSDQSQNSIRVRQVDPHELTSLHLLDPFTLLMTETDSLHKRENLVHFNWTGRERIEIGTIKMLPRRCLHRLPAKTALTLADLSLEILLSHIDRVASALTEPQLGVSSALHLRNRNNFLTLNLYRIMGRLNKQARAETSREGSNSRKRKASSALNFLDMDGMQTGRKKSIWEQGGVPRNGGQ